MPETTQTQVNDLIIDKIDKLHDEVKELRKLMTEKMVDCASHKAMTAQLQSTHGKISNVIWGLAIPAILGFCGFLVMVYQHILRR